MSPEEAATNLLRGKDDPQALVGVILLYGPEVACLALKILERERATSHLESPRKGG